MVSRRSAEPHLTVVLIVLLVEMLITLHLKDHLTVENSSVGLGHLEVNGIMAFRSNPGLMRKAQWLNGERVQINHLLTKTRSQNWFNICH